MTEREKEPTKEEKKERKSIIKILIEKINKLLKEIKQAIKKNDDKEEERLKRELRNVQKKKKGLIASFYQNTDFGRETKKKKDLLEKSLRGALSELRTASEEEIKEKAQKVRRILERKEEEARRHWQQEPDDLEERYHEIAEVELEELIRKGKEEYYRILKEHQREGETRKETTEGLEKTKEELKRLFPEFSEEERERIAGRAAYGFNRHQYLVGEGDPKRGMADMSLKEIAKLADDNLDAYFRLIGTFSGEFYHEAARLVMSLETMNKFTNFIRDLSEAPGREARKILREVEEKIKLRKMYHNIVCAVEQGGGKLEQLQGMMEMFMPQLFDQTFREEEAEIAAHLYDIGTTVMRSLHGNWVPSEKMLRSAKKRDSEIDIWVRDRLEKILRAKYGNEGFEERFPEDIREQKLEGIMALGKGFEFATLRMIEEVARGRIPKGEGVVSPPYEDFVRPADSFEHFLEKFQDGDPGAEFLMFVITKGSVLPGSSRKEIKRLIKRELGVDPTALTLKDVVNFLGFTGPFRGWRLKKMVEGISEEDRKWLGMAISLELAGDDLKKRKEIIQQALKRNPVRVLREAELQDGEILDPEVVNEVIRGTLKQLYKGEELEQKIRELAPKKRKRESDEEYLRRLAGIKTRKTFLQEIEEPLIILAQLEVEKREGEINFDYLKDIFSPEQIRRAQFYYQEIKRVIERYPRTWATEGGRGKKESGTLIEFLAQKKFPYIPGVDDVPWHEFDFERVGQKGIARKFRDNLGVEKAMKALLNLEIEIPKLRKGEDIVKACDEIWKTIGSYGKKAAAKKMTDIYEGIGRFNAANFWKRLLPIPFDALADWMGDNLGFLGLKPTSFAKEIYGDSACSWRAVDLRNFLSHARLAGHITEEQEKELRKRLKCHLGWIALEFIVRAGPIGVALIIYTFLKELKEQLEEQVKEQG